jgi:hypothetical protein
MRTHKGARKRGDHAHGRAPRPLARHSASEASASPTRRSRIAPEWSLRDAAIAGCAHAEGWRVAGGWLSRANVFRGVGFEGRKA